MSKNFMIFFGLTFFTLLCPYFVFLKGDSFTTKRTLAYQITDKLSEELKKKFNLDLMGISESADGNKYTKIGLEFSFSKILTKEEGRILLIECLKNTLNAFNSTPAFKPYMTTYPFTVDNIIINIYIQPTDFAEVYHPEIAIFSLFMNKLEYTTKSPENPLRFFSVDTETYEEALQLIQGGEKYST